MTTESERDVWLDALQRRFDLMKAEPAPARCDAQSAKALDLLQISTCFRGVVCGLLPCACAETLAAALSETQPAHRALRDIISIARDAQATDALGDIVRRAEKELGNDSR